MQQLFKKLSPEQATGLFRTERGLLIADGGGPGATTELSEHLHLNVDTTQWLAEIANMHLRNLPCIQFEHIEVLPQPRSMVITLIRDGATPGEDHWYRYVLADVTPVSIKADRLDRMLSVSHGFYISDTDIEKSVTFRTDYERLGFEQPVIPNHYCAIRDVSTELLLINFVFSYI